MAPCLSQEMKLHLSGVPTGPAMLGNRVTREEVFMMPLYQDREIFVIIFAFVRQQTNFEHPPVIKCKQNFCTKVCAISRLYSHFTQCLYGILGWLHNRLTWRLTVRDVTQFF